jgi:hypothetical protein
MHPSKSKKLALKPNKFRNSMYLILTINDSSTTIKLPLSEADKVWAAHREI